jgi:hypothetical protein
MDSRETNEVLRSAWLTVVLLCLGVGGVLYAVFLFAGLLSTDPVPIRWWMGIASASFVVIIVLIIRGRWI